jgi:hypothetical protein
MNQRPLEVRMVEQVRPPSRREVVSSALISVGVTIVAGLVITFLVGFPAVWVDIAMTDPAADASTPTGLPEAASRGLFVVVLLLLWPVTCRLGRGTWGDTVMDLKELTVTGAPAGRGRCWARTGIVLAVLGIATVLGRPGAGMLVIVVQWAPALVRADRRSLVDLLVGVVPHSTASPKLGRPLLSPPSAD